MIRPNLSTHTHTQSTYAHRLIATHLYSHTHMQTHMYPHTHTSMYTHRHTHTHTHTNTHTPTHTHTTHTNYHTHAHTPQCLKDITKFISVTLTSVSLLNYFSRHLHNQYNMLMSSRHSFVQLV